LSGGKNIIDKINVICIFDMLDYIMLFDCFVILTLLILSWRSFRFEHIRCWSYKKCICVI